ncbi:hypothetical protein BOM_1481 (plasmid) [Borrelia miyamotoi FR64b]|uniref:Uncharacterized protein n=1 Tax=Borrelia miyamotoi FR64b TaxID=1292392 RepID=W5SG01_9SPIR|nr:hypothetical protein BOM_0972 [Borrelia miyamotoi FR64b]AHH05886.1 hypothetical protein BOM_1343 [Borrelia miyamotoi FR64b]AHH06024.1 hypothetical protein BOM_1481 [Borrelia miyamotoi FR64b]
MIHLGLKRKGLLTTLYQKGYLESIETIKERRR